MSWYNPLTWPAFNGGYDNPIPTETGSINGTPVRMWLDVFNTGKKQHIFYPERYNKYVALQKEVFVVNNAIGKIAKVVSKADFVSEKDNDVLVSKLNNPNQKQSKQEFLKEFTVYVKAAGWGIVWKKWQSIGNFETLELINIDPDCADFTTNGKIKFEYEEQKHTVELTDVILFYDTVREKDGRGYSALRPLRSQINNVLDAQRAKGIQIENSGTTIVSPKALNNTSVADEGLNAMVHPEIPGQISQKQQIEDKLNNRGIENRVIVASKGLDALNLSSELNGFKFNETIEADILAIYDALGVPVELTPYGKNVTYENKAVAELSLLQSEAMPLVESLVLSLVLEFPTIKSEIKVNFDSLEAMTIVRKRNEESNTKKIEQVVTLIDNQLITPVQAQQMLTGIIPE